MFDISWGELFMLGAVGVALTGRKDLPRVFRVAGTQVGRVVGLMQGARARADKFASENELRQLQNELRSGLRELDQVKTELAVAASSRGMIGRNLGTTVTSANRSPNRLAGSVSGGSLGSSADTASAAQSLPTTPTMNHQMSAAQSLPIAPTTSHHMTDVKEIPTPMLAPEAQTIRATAEEEWEKQGIAFRSRAEQGLWLGMTSSQGVHNAGGKTGSELLENIIKQNLIFDQYDRVVGEQEAAMQKRIDEIREVRNKGAIDDEEAATESKKE